MKKMYPQLSGHVSALVRVVEGEGFAAAAKCPSKVVGTVEDGAAWLSKQLDPERARKYGVGELVRAVNELRPQHGDATSAAP